MADVVGDIAVKVGADVSALQKEMRKGAQSMETFNQKAGRIAKNVAKTGVIVAGAFAAAGAGALALAKSAANVGAEIESLSRIANTTPETFQKMAHAAKTVGIEQDKLADILKDVQDRVGDFLATGGGPMADFFENIAPKVGVTAEQFKNLSGPQSLQLFADSLNKANLSQAEMTFYLEAMSSDLTALQPLLANGGAEFQALGEKAAAAGLVMSNDAVAGSEKLRSELDDLGKQLTVKFHEAILEHKDDIIEIANQIETVWVPAIKNLIEFITMAVKGFGELITLGKTFAETGNLRDSFNAVGGVGIGPGAQMGFGDMLFGRERGISAGGSSATRGLVIAPTGDGTLPADFAAGRETLPTMLMRSDAPFAEELGAQLDAQKAHQEKVISAEQVFQERLAEVRSAGRAAEETAAQEHTDNVVAIEDKKRDAVMSGTSELFSGLASLQMSENEKLFKAGKAAALAEATVSGYQAAVDAWAKGMKVGGPPVAAAFTAASLARTGAMISSIQGTNASGGGGGSSGGSVGGTATAAQAPLDVNLRGATAGQLIDGADVGSLLERLTEEAGDRGLRISVVA